MTAPAIARAVDPTGLNGERYLRDEKLAPYIVELYAYPTTISFDAIVAAWLVVLPRAKHLTGFKAEGVRGGKRLVKIESYQQPPEPKLHIEEPDL